MPELPEVETIRIGLTSLILGHNILSSYCLAPKSFLSSEKDIKSFAIGAKITSIKRRAKVLLIELSSNYTFVIHLKMTGQLVYRSKDNLKRFGAGHPTNSLIGTLPDKSTRVVLKLSEGTLFFNDQRRFGWIRLIPTPEVLNIDFFKKIGPEPLANEFSAQNFKQRLLTRPNTNIKAALLDQTVIAGIGNIYADESLWGAKIHPSSLVKNISTFKLNKLFSELQYVLRLSIEKGGSTDKNYVNAEGKKGNYLSFARVFRRENTPCPRCGATIIKLRIASRGTHICSHCQKVSK